MENVIKKATEGGYNFTNPFDEEIPHGIVLDPLFWQALSKACGWKYKAYKMGAWQTEETDLRVMSDTPFRYPEWQYQALNFHEINLTQGFNKAVEWLEELVTS